MFHAVPGAWRNIEEMGHWLSQKEFLRHVAYVKRRNAAMAKAAAKMQKQARGR